MTATRYSLGRVRHPVLAGGPRGFARGLAFAGAAMLCSPVCGDSVRFPSITAYSSESGAFRFTAVPRDPWWLEQYLPDRVHERTVAGEVLTGSKVCRGVLERKLEDGRYEVVWDRQLETERAPESVLVAEDGRFVVTFNDWGERGYGPNVVVIYDAVGETVRQLGLADFLAQDHIEQLMHTFSQIVWGHGHWLADRVLVLRVFPPGYSGPSRAARFREIRIRLADGSLLEPAE